MTRGEWHEETTADGDVYVYPPDGNYYNRYLVGNGNYTNGLRRDHVRLFVNAARLLAALETLRNAGGCYCAASLVSRSRPHTDKCLAAQTAIAAAKGLEE